MEFFIKQNATLPVLKMQVVKDGRERAREVASTTLKEVKQAMEIFYKDE